MNSADAAWRLTTRQVVHHQYSNATCGTKFQIGGMPMMGVAARGERVPRKQMKQHEGVLSELDHARTRRLRRPPCPSDR